MIPKPVRCKRCFSEFSVNSWRIFTVCPYCGARDDFEGFDYREINPNASEFAYVEAEMDCPKCRSPHMLFFGTLWKCVDCGYRMRDEERVNGVFWFCDECQAYLNTQPGFSTDTGKWRCSECGCLSGVTPDDIV